MNADVASANSLPLSIVVPLYNAVGQADVLLTQLSALAAQHPDLQVIAADDASTDGTAEWVRQTFPAIEVVANKVNGGFGVNVMTGAAIARQPWLASINSDIELVDNPFPTLIAALERDASLFAAMPLIWNQGIGKLQNMNRLYSFRGLCWHTELSEEPAWSALLKSLLDDPATLGEKLRAQAAGAAPIAGVLCGAAFVMDRARFSELGGLSPRYRPFYWEEVDLDFRARRKGWHCAAVPQVAVIHRHSESIDKLGEVRKRRSLLVNQLRFVIDHADQLPGLRHQRMWWLMRSLREGLRGDGDPVLRRAYWQAGLGKTDV